MNTKLTFVVYPVVALLSLAAAFAAHAQSLNDAADHAGYGSTVVATSAVVTAARSDVKLALAASRTLRDSDPADHAAYGATAADGASLRSRAEVRAEANAARDTGIEATYREGGDPQYAVLQRAKARDTAHVMAGAMAPTTK